MVVGAFHVSKRPGNFFEHHHKAKHGEGYYDVMSLSSHSKQIGRAFWDGTDYVYDAGMTKPRVVGSGKEMME